MTKILSAAALLATLALANCTNPSGPVASGANSTAPNAVSQGVGGSVGGGNNSTHNDGGGATGGAGGGANGATGK